MASVGSLSFIAEIAMESSLLQYGHLHRPKFLFPASRGRIALELGSNLSNLGNREMIKGLCMTNGLSRRRPWRSMSRGPMRIYAKQGEDENKSEDILEATIDKSRKVLAVQKELLHQASFLEQQGRDSSWEHEREAYSIAERRKLVSSLRNTMLNNEEDIVSSTETGNSFPDLVLPSDDGDDTDGTHSSSAVVNAPDVVSGSFDEPVLESERTLPVEKHSPDAGFPTIEKTAPDPVEVQSDVLPSFLSKTSDAHRWEDKEKSTETFIEDGTVESNITPEEENIKPPPLAGDNVMNIILVAMECAPWSKTGGLGDVAGALPKALARRGHRVMVVAPRYGNYTDLTDTGVRRRYTVTGQDVEVTYHQIYIDGVDFVFIDNHMFHHLEQNIYGGQRLEILRRMILFCKAAVEVPWYVPCGGVCYGDGNLVFIANDWHTALLPVYLKAYYRDNGLMQYTRSVLVIHNIAHQGRGPIDDFSCMDLPGHYFDNFKLYDPLGGEHCNIFAAGLKSADRIVTVSHAYSWELKTSEGGWGLHGIINDSHWKLSGIVNGIDTKDWNPEIDIHLKSDGYTNYSVETVNTGKAKCKKALQKELGLPVRENVPLIGFIGRLDQQKGVDLIAEAIPWIVEQGAQLVMLGTGREDLENLLRKFEHQHNDRVRGWVGFSVKMSHRITAGADILLMPSRFEPCGLNQLYAMSYGTVPVVHAVGGLRDTVEPFDPYKESGVGWSFDTAETHKLIHALGNCLYTYREYKKSWEGIQRRGMEKDLSWDSAAKSYEDVLLAAKFHW